MALMDVFTHFSIIRRERRGIRPEEIKRDVKTAGEIHNKRIRALLNQGMNNNLAPIQKLVWV
jgi:hypothetical protein